MACKCTPIERCDEHRDTAVCCPKCGQYYPYDCFIDGCKDIECKCDGCETMRHIEGDDSEAV